MPDKGHMSRAEVQQANALLHLSPKQFEKKVEMALRANRWKFWRDVDKGKKYAKANATRMPGHPDFEAWKKFEGFPPKALMKLTGVWKADLTVRLFVEVKTGKATTNLKQQEFIDAANDVPGEAAVVIWPYNFDTLIELLGGERP